MLLVEVAAVPPEKFSSADQTLPRQSVWAGPPDTTRQVESVMGVAVGDNVGVKVTVGVEVGVLVFVGVAVGLPGWGIIWIELIKALLTAAGPNVIVITPPEGAILLNT